MRKQFVDKKLILVLGSPRSGTTFIASEIARILETNLYFEAQWIKTSLQNNEINFYTKRMWNLEFDRNSHHEIEKYYKILSKKYQLNYDNRVIIDHSPQNVLVLKKLKNLLDIDLVFATLRPPKETIISLFNMDWFKGGLNKAIFINLKYLFFIMLHIKRIDFIIRIKSYDESIFEKNLTKIIRLKKNKKFKAINLVHKYPFDKKTYAYNNKNKYDKSVEHKISPWKITINKILYKLIIKLKNENKILS